MRGSSRRAFRDGEHAGVVRIAKLAEGDGIDRLAPVAAIRQLVDLARHEALVEPGAVVGDEVLEIAAIALDEGVAIDAGLHEVEAEGALDRRQINFALAGSAKALMSSSVMNPFG